jgi:hypothetical protein
MDNRTSSVQGVSGIGSDSVLDRFATKFNTELSDVRSATDSYYGSLSDMGTMGQRALDPSVDPTQGAVAAIHEGSVMSAKLALQQVRFSLMHGSVVAATSTFKQLLKTS